MIAYSSVLARLTRAPKNCICLPTGIAETQQAIAVSSYDEIARTRPMEKMAHNAQLFCIAAAFIIPNLLFMAYAF